MISDNELDEIIKAPRPQFGPLQAKDIMIYLDTSCGIEHQSYGYWRRWGIVPQMLNKPLKLNICRMLKI